MWKMQVSPRTLKATEQYIATLGRKREELTEEQWNFLIKYIEGRRIAIPLFLIMCLLFACMTFIDWNRGHKYFVRAIPHHTVKVLLEDQQEPISLSPEEIRVYFNYVVHHYMMAWSGFLLVSIFLTFFCMMIIGGNKKAHRILLSRPVTTETVA